MAITPKRSVTFAIIESPFAPFTKEDPHRAKVELARNIAYLNACLADSFARGEVPFASHGLYTRNDHGVKVLDDTVPEDRKKGMQGGFDIATALSCFADLNKAISKDEYAVPPPFDKVSFIRAFCQDRGWTSGMADGMLEAGRNEQTVDKRILRPDGYWSRERDADWSLDSSGHLYLWRESGTSTPVASEGAGMP